MVLALASVCRAQNVDGTFINKGFNMMLEAEGMGNEATGMGGVACTVGYQVNPNFFVGGGIKNIWGGRRRFRKYRNHLNDRDWYQTSSDNTYWVDSDGFRYVYHAFDKDGKEVFYNNGYEFFEWDSEKQEWINKDLFDEKGNLITDIPGNNNEYCPECGWDFDMAFKMIPYICVKYNLLGGARISPYADLRFGWDMMRSEDNDKYGLDFNAMGGLRMALNDGDQAVNISMGLALTDMRGYSSSGVWGVEKMFLIRFGFEF